MISLCYISWCDVCHTYKQGVITLFVGVGLSLRGWTIVISAIQGAGFLVTAIGVGSIIAGYLYPNDSAEITKAVEDFEEK